MKDKIEVELQETYGSDAAIANSAWTSTYNKDRREEKYDDPEKVAALVPRLVKDGHTTPLEFVGFRFWIRMPIFTDRQHMTHRIQSSSGLSGRYRTMPEDWYSLPKDAVEIIDKFDDGAEWKEGYDRHCQVANEVYKDFLSRLRRADESGKITNAEYKRVRELVRGVLPTAGMVERTTIMNLRSFANYQRLRNSDHAQPEIQTVAKLMLEAVEAANVCPVAISALKSIGWKI
jgi:thymidylate synthase (FAD)